MSDSYRRPSRRQLLGLTAGSAIGVLAGCGGKSGEETTGTDTGTGRSDDQSTGQPKKTTFKVAIGTDPETIAFNPWDRSGSQGHKSILYGWLAYTRHQGWEGPIEYVPHLATDWLISGGQAILTLSEEFTWHDGGQVTAEDVVAKYKLDKVFETPVWEMIDSVESSGNQVIFNLTDASINKEIFFGTLFALDEWVSVKKEKYQEYLDRLEDAESFVDRQEVRTDLTNLSVETPIGWGPFKFEERTSSRFVWTKHEDHPHADKINWDTWVQELYSTRQARIRAILSKEIDSTAASPTNTAYSQIDFDHYREIGVPNQLATAWAYNYDYELFQDRRVRKAFSHLINWEQVRQNAGVPRSHRIEAPLETGLLGTEEFQRQFVGDLPAQLEDYGQHESHQERAANLLRDAGYEKRGGWWRDPDGEQISTTIHATSTISYWENMSVEMASQLESFGIKAEVDSKALLAFATEVLISGDFEMSLYITGGDGTFPYFDLLWMWDGEEAILPERHQHPAKVEIPMPVGDRDGSLETVDTAKQLERMRTSPTDSTEFTDAIKTLCWAYNQYVPVYVQGTNITPTFLNKEAFTAPSQDEADYMNMNSPVTFAAHKGKLQAKTK